MIFFADTSLDNTKLEPESSISKKKKNFKIWLSPRSRKVRCLVEKPSEVTSTESRLIRGVGPAKLGDNSAQPGDMAVFNFTSSSQDSGSSSSPGSRNKSSNQKRRSANKNASRRAMRKQTKETMKKNKLEAINQQWGITGETDSPKTKGQVCTEGLRRSTKRVSFFSPAVPSADPQPDVPKASINDHRPDTSALKGNLSEKSSVLNVQTQPSKNISASVIQSDTPSVNGPSFSDSPADHHYISPLKRQSEKCKADDKVTTLQTTPKRPRVSPARGRKSQMSPAVLIPPSLAIPGCDKKKRYSSPPVQRSPCSPRSASGSPAVSKRNHKGETPLHVASIKVRNSQRPVEHTDDLTIMFQSLENYLPSSNPCKQL